MHIYMHLLTYAELEEFCMHNLEYKSVYTQFIWSEYT